MKNTIFALMFIASGALVGCSTAPNQYNSSNNTNAYVAPMKQGVVIGIQDTVISVNEPNMGGLAIGGVAGGVIGNQIGKGNGRKAMTIIGALAGGAIGSQVNSQKNVQGYAVTIRGYDGEVFTFNSDVYVSVGQRVNYKYENNRITLH